MMILHQPPLFKVISGGQCGADQGGIAAAYEMGVTTGGVAPLHFRTQFGNDPTLGSKYGLVEDASYKYPPRTQKNVEQSDGTLIVASNLASPGCTLTYNLCQRLRKPVSRVALMHDYEDSDLEERAKDIVAWILEHRIAILNVAGNRDKRADYFHFHATHKLVTFVLEDLHKRGLLLSSAL